MMERLRRGLFFIRLLIITAVFLTLVGTAYYVFLYQARTKATSHVGRSVYSIDAKKTIGQIDPFPLGNYNDSKVWDLLHTPYPYNSWAYLWTARGSAAFKKLGVTNWILIDDIGAGNWRDPRDTYFLSKETVWVRKDNHSIACNPNERTDCVGTENVGGWCNQYTRTSIDDWLLLAKSYGGPIAYMANANKIFKLKPQYHTVCENRWKVRLKSNAEANFSVPPMSEPPISEPLSPATRAILLPYLEESDATPKETIDFLKYAKSKGYSIRYVEVHPEWWNFVNRSLPTPQRFDPTEYINKLKIWYREIKKYDPSIQVGVSVLQNDVNVIAGDKKRDEKRIKDESAWNPWNVKLLQNAGNYFDFLTIHYYRDFPDSIDSISALTPEQATGFSYNLFIKGQGDPNFLTTTAGDLTRVYRLELLYLNPAKVNVPIHTASNVYGPKKSRDTINPGSTLFTGMANASYYLNELWPHKIEGKYYPGARHVYIGGFEGGSAWYVPPPNSNPNGDPVFFPIWHIFQAMSEIGGKKIVEVDSVGTPTKNSLLPEVNSLEVRAISNVNTLQIIILNHDPSVDVKTDFNLTNFRPKRTAQVSIVGEGSDISFKSYNDYDNPTRISLQEKTVNLTLENGKVKDFIVPAHSFVLLTLTQR